ncbi:hypothetical protein [Methylobacterium sp. J-092]|nr:hypothetical protein [Methylobacterium sp. J-092]MCJ2009246.1 hypothetical protein [Methylobacterium sp. J-092]
MKSAFFKPILLSPIGFLSLAVNIALQAELWRRMGLPFASKAERLPA